MSKITLKSGGKKGSACTKIKNVKKNCTFPCRKVKRKKARLCSSRFGISLFFFSEDNNGHDRQTIRKHVVVVLISLEYPQESWVW